MRFPLHVISLPELQASRTRRSTTRPQGSQPDDGFAVTPTRFRLARNRVRVRGQRGGAAPFREGLPRRRARVRRRYEDADFARTAWNLRRYFGRRGSASEGCSGSPCSRTCSSPPGRASAAGAWATRTPCTARGRRSFATRSGELADWEDEMRPHYGTAERMLGVIEYEGMTPADELLREYGAALGVADTFKPTWSVCSSAKQAARSRIPTSTARALADRVRALRELHGGLPPRRQEHAGQKLPLVRRAARRPGAARAPRDGDPPIGAPDGSGGYVVTSVRSGAWLRRERRTMTAREWWSPPGRSARTSCSRTASTRGRSLASRRASARSCAPTRSRSRRWRPR